MMISCNIYTPKLSYPSFSQTTTRPVSSSILLTTKFREIWSVLCWLSY